MKNQTKNHAAEQTNYGRLHQLCACVLEEGGFRIGWAQIKKSIVNHISKHIQFTDTVEKSGILVIFISINLILANLEDTQWEQFQSYLSLCSSFNIFLVHTN